MCIIKSFLTVTAKKKLSFDSQFRKIGIKNSEKRKLITFQYRDSLGKWDES